MLSPNSKFKIQDSKIQCRGEMLSPNSRFKNSKIVYMENLERLAYESPTVEVNPVELESTIALQSPVLNVQANEWSPDEAVAPDTGDIYLPI